MKHNIVHEEIVNGIVYKTIEDKDIDRAVDFYFDVFLKGKILTTIKSSLVKLSSTSNHFLEEIGQK